MPIENYSETGVQSTPEVKATTEGLINENLAYDTHAPHTDTPTPQDISRGTVPIEATAPLPPAEIEAYNDHLTELIDNLRSGNYGLAA